MSYFVLSNQLLSLYLNVRFSRIMIRLGKRELFFLLSVTIVILLFLIEGVSSSSGCLGKAVSFYRSNSWAFNISFSQYQ